MAQTKDPWTEEQKQQAAAATEVSLECLHCGTPLVPHFDAAGSLHCNGSQCVACCFLPPDESSNGKPRERFGARHCPMTVQKGGF